MSTFLEGVESITLLCSLVVLVPGLVLALTGARGRGWLVAGFVAGTATMMWARAGGLWTLDADGPARWWIAGAIVLVYGLVLSAPPVLRVAPAVGAVVGGAAGAVAGWLWQPCVGENLADALNRAESDRVAGLLGLHAYVLGLSIPLLVVAALPHAWPATSRALHHRAVRTGAAVVAGGYGLTVAVGRYDDITEALFRFSSR